MGTSKAPKQEIIDPNYAAAAQAYWNRVGQSGPGGSTRYVRGPGGNSELQTMLSPEMRQILSRRAGLAMTDSSNMQVQPGMNQLAGALRDRIMGRLGITGSFDPMQLAAAPPSRAQFDWQNPTELPPDQVQMPQSSIAGKKPKG